MYQHQNLIVVLTGGKRGIYEPKAIGSSIGVATKNSLLLVG